MDIGDRVFLKPRFITNVEEPQFGTITQKHFIGTIPIYMVKWDKLPKELQYSEFMLTPACTHEKYKAAVTELIREMDKRGH